MYDPLNRDPEEVYARAIAIVREFQKGSISLLQRKLNMSWAMASQMIERMEKEGILGPRGSKNVIDHQVLL